MIGLPVVRDDDDGISMEVLGAVKRGREIGRRIIGRSVCLADEERLGLEPRVLGMEDGERALADRGEAGLGQLAIDALKLVVVELLAEEVVEPEVEPVVDRLKRGQADGGEFLPQGDVFRLHSRYVTVASL